VAAYQRANDNQQHRVAVSAVSHSGSVCGGGRYFAHKLASLGDIVSCVHDVKFFCWVVLARRATCVISAAEPFAELDVITAPRITAAARARLRASFRGVLSRAARLRRAVRLQLRSAPRTAAAHAHLSRLRHCVRSLSSRTAALVSANVFNIQISHHRRQWRSG